MAWASYSESGKITGYFEYTPDVSLDEIRGLYSDTSFIQVNNGTDTTTKYVLDGEVADRTELNATWDAETVAADGTAEIVLSGLPVPCTVYVDGNAVAVDDGSLEFSADVPGEYKVRVDEAAYLEQEWTVNAV
tara:strand:- start:177 stop:575 length:399 start_codon:yes stop_codon:yes gene_type:complete